MRGRILRSVVDATFAGFRAILVLAAVSEPIGALTNGPSTPSEEKKQTDQDRCKFLMENVNATILSFEHRRRNHFSKSLRTTLLRILQRRNSR